MLNVNPESVCQLIELAREFHAREDVLIPIEPGSPADEWDEELLAAHAEDSALRGFRSLIDNLDPGLQQEVVGLLWLGRGDYTLDDWEDILDYAADAWNETTADYLIAHPLLADYLTEGLDQHGFRCE